MNNRRYITNYNLITIVVVMILLLTQGCGTASKVNTILPITEKTIVNENEGIVVARVINASGSPLPFNELTLTPKNINESENIKWQELKSIIPVIDGSTVFASTVKTGDYSLNSISTYYSSGEFYYSRFARADTKFGTFTVKANQVTDLGTIIYYTKPQDDRYLELFVHLPEPEIGEVLEKYFPFYQFDKDNVLSWNEDDLNDENLSEYLSIAQNPITFKKTYRSPDGALYFLGKLGIIVRRSSLGDWEIDAVDTNLDLNTIVENNQLTVAVGGDEGKLFIKKNGQDWRDISLTANHQILDVSFTNDTTLTLLTKYGKQQLLVLRASIDQDNIKWSKINQYDTKNGWNVSNIEPEVLSGKYEQRYKNRPKRIHSASITKVGSNNYIRIGIKELDDQPLLSDTDYSGFSFNKDSWYVSKIEEELTVNTAISAGATQLGIKYPGFWSLSGKASYYRYSKTDDTWEKISTRIAVCNDRSLIKEKGCPKSGGSDGYKKRKTFSFRSVPWFKTANDAIAIISFSDYDFWSGESSSETRILATKNGGKTWYDTGNKLPKPYCTTIVTEVSEHLLISCNGASGDFYESKDGGATWDHVRQQENF